MAKTLMEIIHANREEIFTETFRIIQAESEHYAAIPEEELQLSYSKFLESLAELFQSGREEALQAYARDLSERRLPAGFRLSEIQRAFTVFKKVVLNLLERERGANLTAFLEDFHRLDGAISSLLGHFSDAYSRMQTQQVASLQENIIAKQRRALAELSTPVIQVWEGVLVLPIIGMIDSARVRQIMEQLLTRIVESQSEIVILDITGVPTVDTAVANHLIKTVQAARMLGARSIVTGFSPMTAQTVIDLGVDLGQIITAANLHAGLEMALEMKSEN